MFWGSPKKGSGFFAKSFGKKAKRMPLQSLTQNLYKFITHLVFGFIALTNIK
jgi:hypothetical protein